MIPSRPDRTAWPWATRSSTANGCRMTRVATAEMGSGRSTTIPRASPATTRAAAAARGRSSKNIEILSASRGPIVVGGTERKPGANGEVKVTHPTVEDSPGSPKTLADFHAGFRAGRTTVLHKFGTDPNYDAWRRGTFKPAAKPAAGVPDLEAIDALKTQVQRELSRSGRGGGREGAEGARVPAAVVAGARMEDHRLAVLVSQGGLERDRMTVGGFVVSRSHRNPTPLFGLGLIDAIPDAAIEKIAIEEGRTSPETKGRVSRLKDGRIGRLGWKGQTANTEDFVLNACAVELGLEVPGHAQAVVPKAPKYRSPGLDLDTDECARWSPT